MWYCLSHIFCCCPKEDTNNPSKKKKRRPRTSSFRKYATSFDSQKRKVMGVPQMDETNMLTEDIQIQQKQYHNRTEFYAHILGIHGYEVIGDKSIGKGAFGEVYKIRKLATGELMAVKIMSLKKSDEWNKTRFETFRREVYCLSSNPHKNIIRLIQHFIVNDFMSFMIMELADAGDLKQRLEHKHNLNARGFDEFETRSYFVEIADAIDFVHSQGLIHGDLKLDNILIKRGKDGNEVLKVTDFGCANVAFDAKHGVVLKDRAVGTVVYMSPEQLRVYMYVNLKMTAAFKYEFKKYNPFRSDVWALGICLYRLLFYNYPFTYSSDNEMKTLPKMLARMKSGYTAPQNITKDLSDDCKDIIKGLLEYNKDSRMDIKSVMSHKWVVTYKEIKK